MGPIRGVLFDFSDTLFWRDGGARAQVLARRLGAVVPQSALDKSWVAAKSASVTPAELALRRDCSAESHRRCWTALLRPFDAHCAGLAEAIYADQPNPQGWHAYNDTVLVLRSLADRSMPVAVVSDIGWDLRPIFEHHGVADCVQAWVLSYEHGTEKPDPALFLAACASLGIEPSAALMVGDSVSKDGGAVTAGLRALVLPGWSGVGERGLRSVLDLAR